MKYIYLLFCHFHLVLITLTIFFIWICYPYEIENDFTRFDFYESFSPEKECFKLYHNNPTGPLFLVTYIGYEHFYSKYGMISKEVNRKYEFKLINESCTNPLSIKPLGEESDKILLVISISLYYKEEDHITLFSYKFNKKFIPYSFKLVDINSQFGLEVNFLDSADDRNLEYNPSSPDIQLYLKSLLKNDGYICVITQNNRKIVLSPKYIIQNNNLITRIRIEYVKNGEVNFITDYPAFVCDRTKSYPFEIVYLLYEGFRPEIRVSLIYWKSNNNTNPSVYQTSFLNLRFWNFNNQNQILPADARKLFVLQTKIFYVRCPNGEKSALMMSESKYAYHAVTNKLVDVSIGIERDKSVSRRPESPCI